MDTVRAAVSFVCTSSWVRVLWETGADAELQELHC